MQTKERFRWRKEEEERTAEQPFFAALSKYKRMKGKDEIGQIGLLCFLFNDDTSFCTFPSEFCGIYLLDYVVFSDVRATNFPNFPSHLFSILLHSSPWQEIVRGRAAGQCEIPIPIRIEYFPDPGTVLPQIQRVRWAVASTCFTYIISNAQFCLTVTVMTVFISVLWRSNHQRSWILPGRLPRSRTTQVQQSG